MLEDLRQKVIYLNAKFDKNESIWWDYIAKHMEMCWTDKSDECSKKVHDFLKMDWGRT